MKGIHIYYQTGNYDLEYKLRSQIIFMNLMAWVSRKTPITLYLNKHKQKIASSLATPIIWS